MSEVKEGDIEELMLKHPDKIRCFSCGKSIEDIPFYDKVPIGILWGDRGENKYPREPDIPASIYFECWDCFQRRKEGR